MGDDSQAKPPASTVRAQIQQAYDLHLTVNFKPSRAIDVISLRKTCQPRRGASRVEADPLDLPEPTRKKLLGANKRVVEWLAAHPDNQRAFLANPVAALQKAGVELARDDLKAIDRVRAAFGSVAVAPGLQLRSVAATADNGSVKTQGGERSNWKPPELTPSSDQAVKIERKG